MRSKSILYLSIAILALLAFETKAQIITPFHLVNGYILVDAQVDEVKGRFLFDTGTPFNFMLNNNLIPLDKDTHLATGKAGSGQVLEIYKSTIDRINISNTNLKFSNLRDVTHTNFGFMQDSIAADILGTLGYQTIKNYVITIDYDRQILKLDSVFTETPDLMLVTSFYYTNEDNLPECTFTATNGRKIKAYFDTGSLGSMMFSKDYFAALTDEKLLEVYSSGFWYGYPMEAFKSYIIRNISYNQVVFNLKHLSYIQKEDNKISVGYSFLKDYVSVWDFKNKIIRLYKTR